MKKLILLILVGTMTLLTGCIGDRGTTPPDEPPVIEQPQEEPEQPEQEQDIIMTHGADELVVYADEPVDAAKVTFTATEEWVATVIEDEGVTRAEPWVRLFLTGSTSPVSGGPAGENKLTVVLDPNPGATRSAIVRIQSGGSTMDIRVTQDNRTIAEAQADGDYLPRPSDETIPPSNYSVSVTNDGHGSHGISLEEAPDGGTIVRLTAIPMKGYIFKEWIVVAGNITIVNNAFQMPEENVEIHLVFEQYVAPTYAITVQSGPNGTARAEYEKAEAGVRIRLVATPDQGYLFDKWVVVSGGVTIANDIFEMPAMDVEVRAEFKAPEGFNFPQATDPVFRGYCKQFDTDGDGTLSTAEFAAVEEIKVNSMNIYSLDGIECFPNLKVLQCGVNKLTSLDVTQNPLLEQLSCNHNQIAALDVSHNPQLTYLYCTVNQLTSLSLNTGLEQLVCSGNPLATLDVRPNLDLRALECYNCRLTTLDVSQNTNLKSLDCSSNRLTSLDVTQNPLLERLTCHGIPQLSSLDVSHNPELQTLGCNWCDLDDLDVSQNLKLGDLDCANNRLTTLDVSQNSELFAIRCDNNQLMTLDVSHNQNLQQLSCRLNRLPSLDISQNGLLRFLDCGGNPLTSLDMSDVYSLNTLGCAFCHLETLDISNCIYMQEFYGGSQSDPETGAGVTLTLTMTMDQADWWASWLGNTSIKYYTDMYFIYAGMNYDVTIQEINQNVFAVTK